MISRTVVALAYAQVAVSQDMPQGGHGHKSYRQWLPREHVGPAPSAESLVAEEALPASFDIRNLNGQNMAVADWNQHIPDYCGSCWIHGTLSALNDRIKLMRRGQFPDVRLGRQSVVNCVPDPSGEGPPPGCNGGQPDMIHSYMLKNRIPDDTCMPYQAKNMGCTADNMCRNCYHHPNGTAFCWAVDFIGYGVSSYGSVSGEKAMMKEIFARGPIVCSFATDGPFMYNYSENALRHEGVYVTRQKKTEADIDHDMEVAGWGETPSGLKYWVVRNSWGTYWGDAGWLKLERGVNSLMSESDCAWAIPTWDGLNDALEGGSSGDYQHGMQSIAVYGHEWTPPQLTAHSESNAAVPTAALVAFAAGVTTALVAVRVTRQRRVREPALLLG